MSEILSQAEIEALLSSMSQDGAGAGQAAEAPKSKTGALGLSYGAFVPPTKAGSSISTSYEVYDFRRSDKFSKEQLRTMQMLHETFARLASSHLSAYLRCQVNIDLISLEQIPYEEYIRSVSSSVFTIISLPPLAGQAVLEMEFGLVFTMIDRLLGGPGRSIDRNSLTDIERPLAKQTIERMFHSLKTAWEAIVVIHPTVEGMETGAQFVQIAPPSDIVVTILFEVKVGNTRGAMSICVPYLVLKPVITKLSAQKWFVSGNRKQNPSHNRALNWQIQNTQVDCSIRLGTAKLSVQNFLDLRVGDVVRLDQSKDSDLLLLVGNTPKFEGRPAMSSRKLVFNVTNTYLE